MEISGTVAEEVKAWKESKKETSGSTEDNVAEAAAANEVEPREKQ